MKVKGGSASTVSIAQEIDGRLESASALSQTACYISFAAKKVEKKGSVFTIALYLGNWTIFAYKKSPRRIRWM